MTEASAEDVARIAGRLTRAQRAAITSEGHPLPSMGPYGFDSIIIGVTHGRSAKALYARSLAQLPWSPQVLTPLGLAVRAHLLESSQ